MTYARAKHYFAPGEDRQAVVVSLKQKIADLAKADGASLGPPITRYFWQSDGVEGVHVFAMRLT